MDRRRLQETPPIFDWTQRADDDTYIEPSTSNIESEVKIEEPEEPEDCCTIGENNQSELIVCTAHERERYTLLKLLEQKKPSAIILYTMSLQTLRQIELYRACNPEENLQVYCLQYCESTEESRYLEAINRETLSFETLIREQGTLMISREFNVEREEAPKLKSSTRDGGGRIDRRERELDPREQSDEQNERPKVIVDMREFNSELPTILYKKGYDVIAATLEIGDYILSTDIALERKALDDLTQSLQSGRVFKQIEQMLQYYECTVLLIESNTKFETKIVNGGPFQGELSRHCREIRSRLCALIRAHPKMKCIWSLSPENSAEIFIELKLNAPEPNLDLAISLKADQIGDEKDEEEGDNNKKKKKRKPNATIMRMFNNHLNFKSNDSLKLLTNSHFTNLAEVFSSSTTCSTLSDYLPQENAEFLSNLIHFDFSKR
ncbi:unnamed protein product [Caenorhabditis angaria]|uniref:DNA repair endonuclease XPF n=1 Tax=Caenorhabditis angaria TaxID=860376 RepID=A0A9P1IBB8_9PELO|nr:unnamed protein product [Caenorhabditis angaria]